MEAIEIIEEIENLSLKELGELLEILEKKFSYTYVGDCNPIICFEQGKYRVNWMTPKGLCENNSEEANTFKSKDQQLFDKLTLLVEKYQAFLLGKEGMRRYNETIEDRALTNILSDGAYMDMETGEIVNPLTGEKI